MATFCFSRRPLVLAGVLSVLAFNQSCGPAAVPLGPDRVFVSDEATGQVHVLDGSSGRIEGAFKTGARPRGLGLSSDGRSVWVAASDANRLELWDARSLKRLRTIADVSDPERFALSRDGRAIFIANEDRSTISRIALAAGQPEWSTDVGPEPEGIALSPDQRLVVATAEASSTVHFIDAASGRLESSALVGSRPRDVLFVPRLGEIWVGSEQRGTISVFDHATRRLKSMIDLVPEFPELPKVQAVEMELTADGRRAFVAMGRGDRVAELDPATRKLVRSFPSGHRTWGLALSPDGRRLYAASGLSGDLTVVDLAANRVSRTIRFDGKPWGVVAAPR